MTSSPNALTAAAKILTGTRLDDPDRIRRGWQDEAWSFYDEGGPLSYAVTWVSHLLSKARLFAGRRASPGDNPEIIEFGPAVDAVSALAGGVDGQSAMLRSLAIQLTIPGIAYLVGTEDEPDDWKIYSADAIRLKIPATPTSPAVYEVAENDSSWEPLSTESLVVKIWRQHERFHWEPDSPARKALKSLRELRRVGQYIDANLVSRLAGAGIFIIPSEASFPTVKGESSGKHPFITEVMEVMMTAVKQPGTAAQVVPIPVEVPGEFADKFQHLSFSTDMSEKILDIRESALRHTAVTLDIPAEILTGLGAINHWGQWQIEESAIKIHAEPLLETITSALTRGYLIPMLQAQGEDTDGIVVWADTSELTSRPDRSEHAIRLYDRGEASGQAVRRESGLDESDGPTDEELATWAFKQILRRGGISGAIEALTGLGIEIPAELLARQEALIEPNEDEEITAEPGEDDIENESGADVGEAPRTRNDMPPEMSSLLVIEAYVTRALDVARNRINGSSKNDPFLNAWDHMGSILDELGFDVAIAIDHIESYCRTLLSQDLAYDRKTLNKIVQDLPRGGSAPT